MKNVRFLLFAIHVLPCCAIADVVTETTCYVSYRNQNKPLELVMRTYIDNDLKTEIGAIVKYANSKKAIQLVYAGDTTTDEKLNNYELKWLEILNHKITGEYVYAKQGAGSGISAYSLTYKNNSSKKETIFSLSTKSNAECAASLK
jgi:hypothetical protein